MTINRPSFRMYAMLFNWRKSLRLAETGATREARRARSKLAARFRPWLEGLEDRLAPATLTINDLLDRTTADSTLS